MPNRITRRNNRTELEPGTFVQDNTIIAGIDPFEQVINPDDIPHGTFEIGGIIEEPVVRGNGIEDRIMPPIQGITLTRDDVTDAFETLFRTEGQSRRSGRTVVIGTRSPFLTYINYIATIKNYEQNMKKYNDDDIITTRKKEKAKYSECIMLDNGFYYLKTDKDIIEDVFTNKPIDIHESRVLYTTFDNNGKIDLKQPSYYKLGFGKVVENTNPSARVYDGNDEFIVIYDKIPKEHYIECLVTNVFYHKSLKPNPAITVKHPKTKFRAAKCTYSTKNIDPKDPKSLQKAYSMGIKSPTFSKFEGKKYTFGIELETSSGKIPDRFDNELNYEAMRDGSLKHEDDGIEWGGEYVTGVLIGDTGLLQTKKVTNILTKYCCVNKKCGMHIHLGGIDFSHENTVFIYKLMLMVEKEIFSMMPLSRRKNEYCKTLKPIRFDFKESDFNNPNNYNKLIENYYAMIYQFVAVTETVPSAKANKKTQHPMGAKCNYDHKTARYCWINLVPSMFDTRGNGMGTIEIRNHPGTTNYVKIKNYLMIFMALIWFAENHKKTIALNTDITLKYILELAYPKGCDKLIAYINTRISKFAIEDKQTNEQIEQQDYNEVVENNVLTLKEL